MGPHEISTTIYSVGGQQWHEHAIHTSSQLNSFEMEINYVLSNGMCVFFYVSKFGITLLYQLQLIKVSRIIQTDNTQRRQATILNYRNTINTT